LNVWLLTLDLQMMKHKRMIIATNLMDRDGEFLFFNLYKIS
jgi:hypothetical protein